MFGADALQFSLSVEPPPEQQPDSLQYLFPKFSVQCPWLNNQVKANGSSYYEDCILIAEFSEQEGPRPVLVIPKDGGQNFDKNAFSVKILAVDHQSSIAEGCEITEDAQVVMSDPESETHAFIHHIVLNDIQARGYVRPFCISYVTSDPIKIMKCYEEISTQMKKVARLMKYGNRLVFMRDLEKHLEDLSYTKAHLLISQSRTSSQMTAQGDNDLLNALNTIRQRMEEVMDILANLKPILQMDSELSERFTSYERMLKSKQQQVHTDPDSSSLKNFNTDLPQEQEKEISGSYTERATSPEFSLFMKSRDQKPKLLDVSAIRGKRRFDRSLRGLHELCSWGAKEGLQRLRAFREFLKRDLSNIHIDELDLAVLEPEIGVLSFGYNTIGVNFLGDTSIPDSCPRKIVGDMEQEGTGLCSFGSMESFKSLSTSFQSFQDDETAFSNHSSFNQPSHIYMDGQNSMSNSSQERFDSFEAFQHDDTEFMFSNDYSMSLQTAIDLDIRSTDTNSLLETLTSEGQGQTLTQGQGYKLEQGQGQIFTEGQAPTLGQGHKDRFFLGHGDVVEGYLEVTQRHVRANSNSSDFDSIDIINDANKCSKTNKCSNNDLEMPSADRASESGDITERNRSTGNFKYKIGANGKRDKECNSENLDNSEARAMCNNDDNTLCNGTVKTGDALCTTSVQDVKPVQSAAIDLPVDEDITCNNEELTDKTDTTTILDNVTDKSNLHFDNASTQNETNHEEKIVSINKPNVGHDTIQDQEKTELAAKSEVNAMTESKTEADVHQTTRPDSGSMTMPCDIKTVITLPVDVCSVNISSQDIQVNTNLETDDDDDNGMLANKSKHLIGHLTTGHLKESEKQSQNKRDDTNVSESHYRSNTGHFTFEDNEESCAKYDSTNVCPLKQGVTDSSEISCSIDSKKFEAENARLLKTSNQADSKLDSSSTDRQQNTQQEASSSTKPAFLRRFSSGEAIGVRKWRFLHCYKNILEGDRSIGPSLQKVLCGFNNLQHIVYSLLLGRPVVVIGTKKHEGLIRDFVQALSLFVPTTPSYGAVSLLCQLKQLRMGDVHKFRLRGVIRPDRKSADYLLPKCIRRYITIVDVEKSLVYCQPYQGMLLNFITALYNKKKTFKSDHALFSYLQLCLEEISTRAYHFYHCNSSADSLLDIRGTTVPHRSLMLDLSTEKYLNRAGLHHSDCRIVKHLAELVKVQQIEEEFKCKYLTDAPANPFSVIYQTMQTFRL